MIKNNNRAHTVPVTVTEFKKKKSNGNTQYFALQSDQRGKKKIINGVGTVAVALKKVTLDTVGRTVEYTHTHTQNEGRPVIAN